MSHEADKAEHLTCAIYIGREQKKKIAPEKMAWINESVELLLYLPGKVRNYANEAELSK